MDAQLPTYGQTKHDVSNYRCFLKSLPIGLRSGGGGSSSVALSTVIVTDSR